MISGEDSGSEESVGGNETEEDSETIRRQQAAARRFFGGMAMPAPELGKPEPPIVQAEPVPADREASDQADQADQLKSNE